MSGGFPLRPAYGSLISIGANTGSSGGTDVPANASANTLGSWVQLTSSLSQDIDGMIVSLSGWVNLGPCGALTIGVGAAASEIALINNLLLYYQESSTAQAFGMYDIPVSIAAGTRIAARSQVNHASDGITVSLIGYNTGFNGYGLAGVDSLGFNAATSAGTSVDPGGSANTKGAYSQLIASTIQDYAGLFLAFDMTPDTLSGTPFTNFLMDVAVGGSGSEMVIIPNINVYPYFDGTRATGFGSGSTPIFWVPIPAGTRISVRAQSNITTSTTRKIGVTAYGIY